VSGNLVNCPDCGRQISRLAPNCPGCGRPMNQLGTAQVQPTTMIEQTSKRYKKQMAIGAVIFGLGLIVAFVGIALGMHTDWDIPPEHPVAIVGALMVVIGLAISGVAAIRGWWHHG